jgi:predicted RNA-binding Zn-ribbon protein involved in translation (DUF1610 family)
MGGYDITCDPGDLYTRKCYVNVHSPSGCLASDPACTITQQEIISYTGGGDPISKAPSANRWQAWVPTLTTLDQAGIAYQPYGEAGLPFTATGIAGYSETPFTDDGSDSSDSTDSQVTSDGVSGGSAASKKGIPTWIGVIGAVGAIAGGVFGYKKWKVKQGVSGREAEGEQSHPFGVDAVASDYWHCGKCQKTWDTQDDAEACCPTYSCPHCKEVVVQVEQHADYRCPHCGDSLGEGYDWRAVNPAWVGDGVVKNAELGKDSCCCGATADEPCACMIKGVMDCSATCPCSLAKDAETFEAKDIFQQIGEVLEEQPVRRNPCPQCSVEDIRAYLDNDYVLVSMECGSCGWSIPPAIPHTFVPHQGGRYIEMPDLGQGPGLLAPVEMDGQRRYVHMAESFEAPYAGKGALMGITQNTDLSDFTPEELATSSAIHGDFNQASLDYSGHQNIQVRSAEDIQCEICGSDERLLDAADLEIEKATDGNLSRDVETLCEVCYAEHDPEWSFDFIEHYDKNRLIEICKHCDLSTRGSADTLRDRIEEHANKDNAIYQAEKKGIVLTNKEVIAALSIEDPDDQFFTSVTFKDDEGNVGHTAAVMIPGDRGIDGEFYHDYRIITEIPMHGHWDDDEEGFMAESSNTVWLVNSCMDGLWEEAELHRDQSKARARLEEFIKDLGGDPKDAEHNHWAGDDGFRQALMYQVTIQESESEME